MFWTWWIHRWIPCTVKEKLTPKLLPALNKEETPTTSCYEAKISLAKLRQGNYREETWGHWVFNIDILVPKINKI